MVDANPKDGKPRKRGPKPGQAKGNAGIGRQKGVPNKTTMRAREAIADLVEKSVPEMLGWLKEIKEVDGPKAAWQCLNDVLEYHIPKLSRSELTGANGGPVEATVQLVINGIKPSDG